MSKNPYEPTAPLPVDGGIAYSATMEAADMAAGKTEDGSVVVDVTMADGGRVRFVLDDEQTEKTIRLLEAVRDG